MANITAKIYLNDGTSLTFDKRQILSVESLSQITTAPNDISYGAVSNTGTLNILDINKEIYKYIKDGLLDAYSLIVDIYIDNNLLQRHVSTENQYDVETLQLTLQLGDVITKYNDTLLPIIPMRRLEYIGNTIIDWGSAYDVLSNVLGNLNKTQNEISEACSNKTIYNDNIITIKELLEKIWFKYPCLDKDTAESQLNSICNIAHLSLISDNNGNLKFYSLLPVIIDNNYILIPYHNMYSNFKYQLLKHNNYNSVAVPTIEYSKSDNTTGIFTTQKLYICDEDNKFIANTGINDPFYNFSAEYQFDTYRFTTLTFTLDMFDIENLSEFDINRNPPPLTASYKIHLYRYKSLSEIIDEGFKEITDANVNWDTKYKVINNLLQVSIEVPVYSGGSAIAPESTYAYYNEIELKLSVFNLSKTSTTISFKKKNEPRFTVEDSSLLQKDATIDDKLLYEYIANNILTYYSKGLSNGTLTVSCADYYNKNGEKIINWANGELLQVNDIVKIEGNDNIWRITGRKFRKNACPFIDLELMEVIPLRMIVQEYNAPLSRAWSGILYHDNKYIIWAFNGIFQSEDMINWSDNINPISGTMDNLKVANGALYRLAKDFFYYKKNGEDAWTEAYIDRLIDMRDIAYGNNKYVVVGYSQYVALSSDGQNWLAYEKGNTINFSYVCYGANKFIAICSTRPMSTIYSSRDGQEWNEIALDRTYYFTGIAFGNDTFIITAEYGINDKTVAVVLKSKDGINWSDITPVTDSLIDNLTFVNNNFIFNTAGYAYISFDGTTWTTISIDDTNIANTANIDYDGKNYIGIVPSSTDIIKFNINNIKE